MSHPFSREQVEHVAALAHLELTDDERDLFAQQLGDILAYADQVQSVDTTGVPPTASVITNTPRTARTSSRRRWIWTEAIANAPDGHPAAGLFRVPRVIG